MITSLHHLIASSQPSINVTHNITIRYDKALEAVEGHEHQLKEHKLVDIGQKYLEDLMDQKKFQQAAALCPRILMKDQKMWETWIYKFGKIMQLRVSSTAVIV